MTNKQYIGDGVYVKYNNYEIILTTKNGIAITNTIVLEAEVLNNLNEYLKVMFQTNQLGKKP
jgi:hypothetical protein